MPVDSSPDVLALTTLRLRSLAERTEVASAAGLTDEDATALLEGFEQASWVTYRAGALSGWALTRTGRIETDGRLADELDAHHLRVALRRGYQAFLAHNTELLALCTAWQLRDVAGQPTVNEHDDPAYDDACIGRLADLHRAVMPIVADLGQLLARFEPYGDRLERALDRVRAGEIDYFTSPGVDSYHTVWFELHEHLLASLGIERATEEPGGSSATSADPADLDRWSQGLSDRPVQSADPPMEPVTRPSDVGAS